MKRFPKLLAVAPIVLSFTLAPAAHAEEDSYALTIKNHRFEPQSITIPAHKKVKMTIKNLDATPEEFDSDDLHREKVIPGGKEGLVYIGPLDPGTYKFKGEYNPATAIGMIYAK